jgi:hypothetical protein
MNYFITYGDSNYSKSKKRLLKEAIEFGFDICKTYSKTDLSEDFIRLTYPYINYKRGGGYWIWKAFILNDIFSKMHDGDVVTYLDAGCRININGKARFENYLDILDQNKGFLAFHLLDCDEYMYTNQTTLDFFGINKESPIYNSSMFVGGIMMFKKNYATTRLINEFYKIATTFPNIFSDENSFSFDERFIEHRHDQSVLSILRKKYGVISIPDETCLINWKELSHTPFHAMRIKDIPFIFKVYNKFKYILGHLYDTYIKGKLSENK